MTLTSLLRSDSLDPAEAQMSFRESVNNLIRTDRPESTSRAIALFAGINVVGWIWYALIYEQIAPLLGVLAQMLSFIAILLGVKQITEKKQEGAANDATGTP